MQMNFVPANDAASRYAPMARAFSEENWAYAFHPHSGVLFSSVSGSLAYLLHLDGFRACQAAALLLWGLAAVPLYFIAMHIWQNRKTAAICEILYLLCSHLQRYVYDGIRDNGKSLGIFLLVYGILLIRDNKTPWKTIIITSLGSVILMLLRIDGV